jgi:hypothetical protein
VVGIAPLLLLTVTSCTRSTGTTPTGDPVVKVPNVVGLDYAQARKTLEQMGFEVQRRDKVGDHGSGVRRQDPAADEGVPPGSTVTLLVVSRQPDGKPAADTSWEHGLIIGPSFEWVQGGTITLWFRDRPAVYVAIVHAPHGYYAIGLRSVAPCPPDNSGSGEGQHVDRRTGDIVFQCANGDVWARFDWFGRSVPGAPFRLTRPAYKVIAKADGRLVVTKHEPPMPLGDYW